VSALLQFHKQDFRPFDMLETFPLAVTAEEIAFESAVDKVATPEAVAGWLESADHIREMSRYFGPISNEELFAVVLSRKSNAEQREQAVILLHRRFVDEHLEEVQAELAANKEYQS
jgi:hypothetical protein